MEPVFTPTSPIRWYKKPRNILLLILLGLIIAAILGFIGLVAYYSVKINRGEGEEILQNISGFTRAKELEGAAQKNVSALDILSTISGNNPTKGNDNAPVTIMAFVDFECPYSQSSHDIFNKVVKQYGSAVQVIYKHFPIASIHPQATNASLAAACAQEQGTFWEYYDTLFNQESLSDATYETAAKALGLNYAQFNACYSSKKYLATVDKDVQDGLMLGVQGTPTYFVNAKKIEGVPSLEQWNTILLTEMK